MNWKVVGFILHIFIINLVYCNDNYQSRPYRYSRNSNLRTTTNVPNVTASDTTRKSMSTLALNNTDATKPISTQSPFSIRRYLNSKLIKNSSSNLIRSNKKLNNSHNFIHSFNNNNNKNVTNIDPIFKEYKISSNYIVNEFLRKNILNLLSDRLPRYQTANKNMNNISNNTTDNITLETPNSESKIIASLDQKLNENSNKKFLVNSDKELKQYEYILIKNHSKKHQDEFNGPELVHLVTDTSTLQPNDNSYEIIEFEEYKPTTQSTILITSRPIKKSPIDMYMSQNPDKMHQSYGIVRPSFPIIMEEIQSIQPTKRKNITIYTNNPSDRLNHVQSTILPNDVIESTQLMYANSKKKRKKPTKLAIGNLNNFDPNDPDPINYENDEYSDYSTSSTTSNPYDNTLSDAGLVKSQLILSNDPKCPNVKVTLNNQLSFNLQPDLNPCNNVKLSLNTNALNNNNEFEINQPENNLKDNKKNRKKNKNRFRKKQKQPTAPTTLLVQPLGHLQPISHTHSAPSELHTIGNSGAHVHGVHHGGNTGGWTGTVDVVGNVADIGHGIFKKKKKKKLGFLLLKFKFLIAVVTKFIALFTLANPFTFSFWTMLLSPLTLLIAAGSGLAVVLYPLAALTFNSPFKSFRSAPTTVVVHRHGYKNPRSRTPTKIVHVHLPNLPARPIKHHSFAPWVKHKPIDHPTRYINDEYPYWRRQGWNRTSIDLHEAKMLNDSEEFLKKSLIKFRITESSTD